MSLLFTTLEIATFAAMRLSKAPLKLYYFTLYLTAFVIPLPFIASAIAVGLLACAWLLTADLKRIGRDIRSKKLIVVWLAFFGLHIISYFISKNKEQAVFDIQTKVSFLILPIVIGTGVEIDKRVIENSFSAFITGLFVITLYSFGQASVVYSRTHDVHAFIYHNLVEGLDANAPYYSLYTFLALNYLLLYPITGPLSKKYILYPLALIFLAFFILLAARLLLLLFFVTVIPAYLLRVIKVKKVLGALIFALGVVLIYIVFFTQNPIHKRYDEVLVNTDKTEWLPEYSQGKKQHFTNLTLRLFLWNIALQNVAQQNLWVTGCGIGDVTETQKKKIQEYGTTHEILNVDPPLWEYNIHNMYIQNLLMLGISGFLLFVTIIFGPFSYLKKAVGSPLFFVFHLSAAVFMLQESAFQTQAGIIFYAFFYMITLWFMYPEKETIH